MPRDPGDLRKQLEEALGDTYSLERELGGGGMSRVYLAEERAFGRRVVAKVLAPDLAHELSADRYYQGARLGQDKRTNAEDAENTERR